MKLLIRPRWRDGESWCGYLMRIAYRNAMPSVLKISKISGIPYARLLMGQPAEILKELQFSHQDVPQVRMDGRYEDVLPILPKGRRRECTTVCPDCLRTDPVPFLRAIWDFPLEVSCRIHKTRLLAICPRCSEPVHTRKGKFLRCACGADLKDWNSIPYEMEGEKLRSRMGLDSLINRDLTFQHCSDKELSAYVVLRNLAYESGLRVSNASKGMPRLARASDRYDVLQTSAAWFDDWPRSFSQRLQEASLREPNTGVFHRRMHLLYLHMFPDLKLVVDEILRDRAKIRIEQNKEENMREAPLRMNLVQVQSHLGITKDVCIAWTEAGVFGPIEVVRKRGYALRFVSRKTVEELRDLLRKTISVQEASDSFGLTTRAIYALIKSDLLKGPRLLKHAMTTRLRKSEVERFALEILKISRVAPMEQGMRSLSSVIYDIHEYAGAQHVISLVQYLKEKSLPIYKTQASKKSLENLFIPRSAVARFYRRVRREYALSA